MTYSLDQRFRCLSLLFLLLAHIALTRIWLAQDNQPPLWDMALHQTAGLAFHDYYTGKGRNVDPATGWWNITGAYPPFYHHLLAIAFCLGRDSHAAAWANLPATLMLVFGTYLLGRRLFSRRAGILAAVVFLGLPYVSWMSRETTIDFTLAAVVLGGILCLEYSDGFARRAPALGFGICAALSALTKWIGPLFLILPAVWQLKRNQDPHSGDRMKNLLDALIVAGILTLPWYLPKLPEVVAFLKQNTQVGAAEGEPPVFSIQSAIYYLRLLEGVQTQAFFFVFFCVGLVYAWRQKSRELAFLLCWILGGYAGLTLLRTKDPRFTLPYLPAVALLSVCWVDAISRHWVRKTASALLVVLAAGHFYLASFGWKRLPEEIVFTKGYQGSYSWDWKLYAQSYAGLLGAPVREVWPQSEILERITQGVSPGQIVRLGIVPDLPRFNHENVRLEARLRELPVHVERVFTLGAGGERLLQSMHFVIVAEGEQGMSWSTRSNLRINDYIFARPDRFQVVGFAKMPKGPTLRIYRVLQT